MGQAGSVCCRDGTQTESASVAVSAEGGIRAENVEEPKTPPAAASLEGGAPGATTGEAIHHEISYEDNSSYKGQIRDGSKRHGHGKWTSEVGAYDGQWHDDEQHGDGKQTWSDGRSFTGKFHKGVFHGEGKMEWQTPNGLMVYEGQYENDNKHGQGKFTWPDGRSYTGQWENGLRNGKATYLNSQGQERRGIWKDDKLERWLEPHEK